jgi:dTDP-4-amino-4,6-dideoxygalactose transaminase
MIPLSCPDITDRERQAVAAVLETAVLSGGSAVARFEQAIASYVGTAHAIAVNSGTGGLHLSIIAAGVRDGDLVIATPFSFVASANCILYERAIPIFVDVDPTTGNLNPILVAEAAHDLTTGGPAARRWWPRNIRPGPAQLKALLPVHVFGQPADMDPLAAVALAHDLAIIEDACEALGATYRGRPAGTLGQIAVFSFYPNKPLTTGEGGMVVTDRDDWAALVRSLRNQGRDLLDDWLTHLRLGYNYRLDELSAALGWTQMLRVEELLARRARVAHWYNQRLTGLEWVELPATDSTTTHRSWFVYVVRIKPPAARHAVMRHLSAAGIPSRPYFPPIHLQPFYRERFGYQRGDFPIAEHLGDVSLALPFSSVMTETQVDYVCDTLRKAVV